MTMNDYDINMGPDPVKLMIAGDWHGNYSWARKALWIANKRGVDTIVQLGDFGYWPNRGRPNDLEADPGFVNGLAAELRRYGGMRLFWVDGNHENHDMLNPGSGSEVIQHLPRGFRWQWWGKTWMSVGGGVSVDKKWRKQGVSWFPEETLTPEQFEYCLRDGTVDIIVSHDCPDKVAIPGIHGQEKTGDVPSLFPPEAIAESEAHRALLGQIVDHTHTRRVFHGHYHRRYNGAREPDTRIIGLAEDASQMNHNTLTLVPGDLEDDGFF
jgi:hypothetical protein